MDEKLKEFVESYYGEPAPLPEDDRFPDWLNTFGFAQAVAAFVEKKTLEGFVNSIDHDGYLQCPDGITEVWICFNGCARCIADRRLAALAGKEKDGLA